jgi:hypothetical protein
MTTVQTFLRSGGTLADLAGKYAIKATRHRSLPHLVSLKYNQIDSPFGEQIVRECRGIVLDESNGWACVARGFDKFFNHGEGHAAEIDWSTARVQEKVDGSLCTLYRYGDELHVATTGTPDGAGMVGHTGVRFSDLFWSALAEVGAEHVLDLDGWALLFELTAPENRVVVPHAKRGVTLLAARHWSGGEMPPVEAAGRFFAAGCAPPVVREFPLQGFDAIAETFASLPPLHNEGYVVVDGAFRRVKVKHPGYVAIHHAKDGLTPRAFVQIALSGEASEVVAAFPDLQADLDAVREKVDALCARAEADFAAHRHIETQKEFALAIRHLPHSGALFQLRAGRVRTAREFFATAHVDAVMRLIGMKAANDDAARSEAA